MKHMTIVAASVLSTAPIAAADFTYFDSDSESAWFKSVAEYTTIDFLGFEAGVLADDAYAHLGILFIDDDPNFVITDVQVFPGDSWGVAARQSLRVTFEQPSWAFGMHFPGEANAIFYRQGVEVFRTPGVGGGGGVDFFEGFTTTEWFDEVLLVGAPSSPGLPDDFVYLDNFYFATVPAPGTLALAALCSAARRRRR